jgi:formamidopyrimidine-DNA glycosylase
MPELPEVETIRRQLEPAIAGRRIESVEVIDSRWTQPTPPERVAQAIAGRTVEAVERRGKYLILRLEGHRSLVIHLRMTGNLLVRPAAAEHPDETLDLMEAPRLGGPRLYESHPEARFLRAVIRLDDGSSLLYTDARRFGHAVVLDGYALEGYLGARLGIEPLSAELSAQSLYDLAQGRTAPLKSFLLDQSKVAGIGNIYADEALHRAELHPLTPAGSLKLEDAERLRAGIVGALEAGLRLGGASIDDYRDARGERGTMQEEFLVHAREGKPCPRCETAIERIVLGGRSTYFCPGCQRKLRRRPRRRAPAASG